MFELIEKKKYGSWEEYVKDSTSVLDFDEKERKEKDKWQHTEKIFRH